MGVLIDNRPRRTQAGAARKPAAPSPWLSAGGKHAKYDPWLLRNQCASIERLVPGARDPHSWTFDPLVVVAVGVWGTIPHSTIATLTALGLSVAATNAALGAALESIAHDSMLISRLRHSPPTRWRGA